MHAAVALQHLYFYLVMTSRLARGRLETVLLRQAADVLATNKAHTQMCQVESMHCAP